MRTADGSTIQEFFGEHLQRLGDAVQGLPDAGGWRLAVGAPGHAGGKGRMVVFDDLDHSGGMPRLEPHGTVDPGMPWIADIAHGLPHGIALLILGASEVSLPFHGGVLVPSTDWLLVERLDMAGSLHLDGHWPSDTTATEDLWVQAWLIDPAGPQGWSATAARRAPPP